MIHPLIVWVILSIIGLLVGLSDTQMTPNEAVASILASLGLLALTIDPQRR